MAKILVIDDNVDSCFILSSYLKKEKFETEEAYSGKSALKLIDKHNFDIAFCDYRLPDFDGIDLLKELKKKNPAMGVVIMTAYADVKIAIQCVRSGALDYITKPIHHQEMVLLIRQFLDKEDKKEQKPSSSKSTEKYVWGKSPQSQKLLKSIELISPTDMSVIIHGESGTGKEYVAKAIHNLSKRKSKPFVAIDCGALSEELAASEMFGHIKGSFTGAVQDKTGQFEYAKGGTLFLDEIGNLSYENQIKLLRVLQERKIRKVGGNNDIDIDVRLLVASNENLTEAARNGKFREDLYHRLNEFMITIDPLRERKQDIKLYVEYFLQDANEALGKKVKEIDDLTYEKLMSYYWHGNLRELKNVVKRAVLVANSDVVTLECIPEEIMFGSLKNETQNLNDIPLNNFDLSTIVAEAEKRAILHVLSKVANNRSRAAEVLKVDRKTLYNKMKQYGIE
ncbi:MAG: sigma-54-dependent transcriptional regulator [Bacteroidia bacterium]